MLETPLMADKTLTLACQTHSLHEVMNGRREKRAALGHADVNRRRGGGGGGRDPSAGTSP